jgi:DNA-binding CsgD family transcriptional regulator
MSLHLNGADASALAEAIRVLLSPLAYASVEEWRTAVHDATRSLFRADQTMTIMGGGGPLVTSEDLEASVLRDLRTWFDPISPEGHLVMADPVVNEWNDRRRESGLQLFTRDLIDRVIDNRVLDSPYVNEALIPNRIHFWQGVYGRGVGGTEAILWVSYDRPEPRTFGEDTGDVLSLLVPAFQGGLEALARVRTASAALDDVAHPLLVFDPSGRELHRSPALASILTAEAAASTVARARALAKAFAAGRRDSRWPAAPVARVSAGGREYLLRVALLPEGFLSGVPLIAVLVLPRTPAPLPEADVLQALYGLTPREAEVALHLATGASRDRIARDLGVSPHTVRAHTEKVFLKLGVSSRSAVAATLVGGVPPDRPTHAP